MAMLVRRKTRKAEYTKDPKKEFLGSEKMDSLVVPLDARGISLNNSILLVAFLDAGLIGPIALDYIIHQVSMHEVAFVESHYVAPATVFIAGQFRHPFRIYSNKEGTVCIAICEVPVLSIGGHSIAESLSEWCIRSKARELVLVAGIAWNSIPGITEESPVRKVYLLQNYDARKERKADRGAALQGVVEPLPNEGLEEEETADTVSIDERIKAKVLRPSMAVIPGVAGSLLASCAAKKMKCTSILVPQNETGLDPEGALLLIELLNRLVPILHIDTSVFKQESEMMKKKLEDLMKVRLNQLKEYERIVGRSDIERIYR
jgi:uncharacterized protein